RHHVTRESIVAANHLVNLTVLRIGQRLRVVGCRTAPIPRRAQRKTDTPSALSSADGLSVVAKVGPLRIPTRLYLAVPAMPLDTVELQWPTEGPVVSPFGRRPRGWHAGIDIQAEMGAPIHAAATGTVIVSGWEATYGYIIKIAHAGGFSTTYAHNQENLVSVGEEVDAGALIATGGGGGRAEALHLP